MMKMKYKKILEYLDYLIPNPVCELNYHKDYELLIAIMLSAQTTDKKVNQVTKILFDKYNSLEKLSKANIIDIKEIIRPLGNYNIKSKNIIGIADLLVNKYNSIIPTNRKLLEELPGIGRKTVNVYFIEYLHIPAMPVDTHIERVTKRLGLVRKNSNVLTIEKTLKRNIPIDKWGRVHQQLVLFGRYYCKAKNPDCDNCHLKEECLYNKTT